MVVERQPNFFVLVADDHRVYRDDRDIVMSYISTPDNTPALALVSPGCDMLQLFDQRGDPWASTTSRGGPRISVDTRSVEGGLARVWQTAVDDELLHV